MRVVVSLASHVHQIPQMGLAQIGPVMRTRVVNTSPISAAELATISQIELRSHSSHFLVHAGAFRTGR